MRLLFVGDDWAEDHHDVELVEEAGTVLARKRLPEGLADVTGLHALIGSAVDRALFHNRTALARQGPPAGSTHLVHDSYAQKHGPR